MSPATASFLSDSRLRWKKRKRDASKKPRPDEDDEEDEEEEDPAAASGEDRDLSANPGPDQSINLRQGEVLSDSGKKLSNFPLVIRRSINRPHPSVLAIAAAERWTGDTASKPRVPVSLENVSHGQMQALSAVLPDNPSLSNCPDLEKPHAFVCTPPPLLEGKGVVKRFGPDQALVLPMHADWFNPNTVHRLERQVVPHYFSGKSGDHTPEKYMLLRNRVVAKYMENPGKRLSFADLQGIVSSNEIYDLSRVVRFLDHWGIINYLAVQAHGPRIGGCLIREEANGELHVTTAPLKSIDSLVQFERPRSSYRPEDIATLCSSASLSSAEDVPDLDGRIRERLSEHSCSSCSHPLLKAYYQSLKEADTSLCSNCFHDAKFVIGHSSLDFIKMDSIRDLADVDGDSWSDQETFLLLEALEIYNDNWNEIAEHVGTKSKAQCILHFIRLPMEDGLLENIDFPTPVISPDAIKCDANGVSNSNGFAQQDSSSWNQLPFATATNPVMAMVAFLGAAIGPRVAATCASAALSIMTKEDTEKEWTNSESMHPDSSIPEEYQNSRHELVKLAAMIGLSAAAIKAKLFADQEEREIQRLSATIINHQLKKLELKLKQFAEVETLLLKECEQVERTRQRLAMERVRMASTQYGQVGGATVSTSTPVDMSNNSRQPTVPTGGQTNISSAYGNNLSHPHMPFLQRQPMFPYVGPRLPLSAIHPSSSSQPANIMLNSGLSNSSTPNHHQLLRSLSGNNTNLG